MKTNEMIILGAAVAAVYVMTRPTAKPAAKGSGSLRSYSNNVLGSTLDKTLQVPYVSGGTLIADRPRSFANDYGNAIDNFFANGFAV